MKKKVCIIILFLSMTGLLKGISDLIEGIYLRGFDGVNYGRAIFPLLVMIYAAYFLKKMTTKK